MFSFFEAKKRKYDFFLNKSFAF